jgi:DNA-binding transcriptional LysR family regulator
LDLRRLDLNLLRVLDALFEEGNITRVGQRLQMSQPTVSSALGKLRVVLGDELFLRSNGVMRPTDRALRLRAPVAAVLASIRTDILGEAGFDPETDQGLFTVSLSDVGELEFAPGLVERLTARAPAAALRTILCDPHRLADAMEAGDVDLAVGYLPDLNTAVFKQQVLFQHGYVCIARQGHPAFAEGLTLEGYFNAQHVTVSQETRFHDLTEVALGQIPRRRQVTLTVSHYVNVAHIVSRTDLLATIPRPLAKRSAEAYPIALFEPPFDIPAVEIKQVWHRRFDASPRVVWLRNLVAEMSQNKPSL